MLLNQTLLRKLFAYENNNNDKMFHTKTHIQPIQQETQV